MEKIEEKKEGKDDGVKELPSKIISGVNVGLHEVYQYLQQVEVKGHQNSKIMNGVFDSFIKISSVLDEVYEDILNLESSESLKKNDKGDE